jgi:hypothetical protein
MAQTPQELWPISSESFSEAQVRVWLMKSLGMTLRECAAELRGLPDPDNGDEGATFGEISTSCIRSCLRRTAVGRKWSPHHRPGRPHFLNRDEKVQLSEWVNNQLEPPTLREFVRQAEEIHRITITRAEPILVNFGCPDMAAELWTEHQSMSNCWGRRTAKDQNLKLTFPEAIDTLRLRFATSALVTRWFGLMQPEIVGTPQNLIFNFDEIMVSAEPHCKVVTSCDKRVFRRREGRVPHITLGLCVSPFAEGPPPLFIVKALTQVTEFEMFHPSTLRVLTSASGWMTGDLFHQWAEMFVDWLDGFRLGLQPEFRNRTAILLLDNCQTHCVMSALQIFAAHNCKVISFPPHMTHVMQPIDVACARAFKSALGRCLDHFQKHPDQLWMAKDSELSRTRTRLVMAALSALGSCTMQICLNGFERCGIWPWSLQKVLDSPYVQHSPMDPEVMDRMSKPEKFYTGSSVMTSPNFLNRLNQWMSRRNGGG